MKVIELLRLHDSNPLSQEHWSFGIYDLSGNIEYGYINAAYTADNIHPAILDCDVKSYIMGYTSLYLKIDPIIETEYQSEEKCKMDGYEHIDVKGYKTPNNLYVKENSNGNYSFAKVTGY